MTKHRFSVDKLIRDKLPQIMASAGILVSHRVMDDAEYDEKLRKKLLEEADEVLAAVGPREIQEELADVPEVLMALTHLHDLDFSQVVAAAAQKKEEKGGFQDRIGLDYVEMSHDHAMVPYYRARPKAYQEIDPEMTCKI
jgi:predicted house-cleaning noncanonical NTP pyrophosphatase (MazG superfamily)